MSNQIIHYKPLYKTAFKDLNLAWLNRYFEPEAYDLEVLTQPESSILDKGGQIYFLLESQKAVGTFALMFNDAGELEFTKMAVDERCQGKGYGNLLMQHCITEAQKLNSKELILYSNTLLVPAINLYRKFGFEEISFELSHYKRANIKMLKKI